MVEQIQVRVHGADTLPTLVYLPGLHGDWTLIGSFRAAITGRVRFVELTYPRTLTWSLEAYAAAVESALGERGVVRGWLAAESFSSQVAWRLCARSGGFGEAPATGRAKAAFQVEGLVLAGGFVRYPSRWRVALARRLCAGAPIEVVRGFLRLYAWYAPFRHRHAPESAGAIPEFIARRTELDRQAMVHRIDCIAAHDPRPIARATRLPIFQIAGFFDPVVPRLPVRRWLHRHCPGFGGSRTIWSADHNVLSTAPRAAAAQVLAWMEEDAAGGCGEAGIKPGQGIHGRSEPGAGGRKVS
jgi:pimeloyl-ACP methyl ester carboxylesterase